MSRRLIDKDDLILKYCEDCDAEWEYCSKDMCPTLEHINEAPIVDAVSVVRCKDCKYYNQDDPSDWFRCDIFQGSYEKGFPTEPHDYCSYGERRTDGTI